MKKVCNWRPVPSETLIFSRSKAKFLIIGMGIFFICFINLFMHIVYMS